MIFRPELCEAILRGDKTQTRRLSINYNLTQKLFALGWVGWWAGWERAIEHANELLGQNRITLAIQPGRGKPTIFYDYTDWGELFTFDWSKAKARGHSASKAKKLLGAAGWHRALIHILKLRREPLQDISEEDAIAEGCNPIQYTSPSVVFIPDLKLAGEVAKLMFSRLWDSINSRKGDCWADNPTVIVHEFELANSLHREHSSTAERNRYVESNIKRW